MDTLRRFLRKKLLWPALCSLVLAGAGARAEEPASACAASARGIPARAERAPGASEFIASVAGLGDHARDEAIRDELLAGNLPQFLRRVRPAILNARLRDGRSVQLTLCVLSDYLGLGADNDFLLVPMGLDSALAVATKFGFTLPTRRIVDLIYRAADVHLLPQPLPANDRMRSTAYLQQHGALVARQRAALGAPPGALTAGHKKDLVLSERLWRQPGRVAIYGWQRADGTPIQPLSTVHGERYADYSHGVRLVSQTMFVDGRPARLLDVLADDTLGPLLSDEGPLAPAAGWLAARAGRDGRGH
ncbi:MAG TPA: hypothetical protein VFY73_13520 [Ideonella sp.]|uniref:hypothetical protein n=1 Tax=Ideonella sp. TaxID=1929293 RepID=UPI002E37B50E|nr:hypothetical protein [Ideonella sp.]HEX5685036.1 hypothetical protein [Ideonella sp.]